MDIQTLPVAVSSIDTLESDIVALGEHEPHKAYLIAVALGKLGDKIKKQFSDPFKQYFTIQKELPGGFECKITERRTYEYESDEKWSKLNALLKEREAQLKQATEMAAKGASYVDDQGEIVDPVKVSYLEVYSVSRK